MSSSLFITIVVCLIVITVVVLATTRHTKVLKKRLIESERTRKRTRNSLDHLMRHSSDFLFKYNRAGEVISASPNVRRLLGFPLKEPVPIRNIVTNSPVNHQLYKHMRQVFETGRVRNEPYFIEIKDSWDNKHILEVFEVVNKNSEGYIKNVTGIARDVTDQYNAELELKQSENKQLTIIKALPDAIFTIDREIRYVDYTVQNEEELWFKPSHFIGKKVADVVPEPMGSIFTAYIEKVFETGELQRIEYSFRQKGQEQFYEGRIIKLDEQFVMVISRPITAQKQVEVELRKAAKAAESAAQAKSNFLATMSHEIRTPMNGVIGMTNLLAETELTEDQKEYVETIKASGETLLRIINDILDYSKIESGKLQVDESVLSLKKLVDDSASLIMYEAKRKNLAINTIFEEDTPEFVISDRGRLRQILLNLLSNAVKFTESGGVTVFVSSESQSDKSIILNFKVQDTGIGIPQDKLNFLFKEFSQADSSHTRKFGGTGLGLAIVKNLVKLLNGKVSVESQVGVGSEFSFTVVARMVNESNLRVIRSKAGEEENEDKKDWVISQNYPLKVLVAEDNTINSKLTSIFLERMGLSADFAISGEEVVSMCREANYDVVLMDVAMPGMDGYEATQVLKQAGSEAAPYIIGVSANAFKEDIKRALDLGMDDYLSKPIKFEELREKMIVAGQKKFPVVP
ncbi:ATP-binding protein [Roseivirga pacifica]|uniref:ATP-binding protein n=1 Tax=Roseivirga pacifica TaxID=1267423 RepID=UPI00209467EB|nr:ATP-binding protein [Roseivirga pacifica]MCO6360211.1 response regulator [Roseivirga pacifica]MCO6367582.1 response regulator [Roseivirga pacifica]MCO6369886.1 response regulator [Roseivirga pacifica]MCO6375239.1 response regulator [Roseivirga pacifica]